MLVKNNSARPWGIAGKLIAPMQTLDVDCTEADVKDNADLEIVAEKAKPGPKPKVESAPEAKE